LTILTKHTANIGYT